MESINMQRMPQELETQSQTTVASRIKCFREA